jgi:hypothetical protein
MPVNKTAKSVAPVLTALAKAGANVDALKSAVGQNDPQEFVNVRNAALEHASAAIQKLSIDEQHSFLRDIADISADFMHKMNAAQLYNTRLNNEKMAAVKRFLAYVFNTASSAQVHLDLDNAIRKFYSFSVRETQEQIDKLKQSIGTHDTTAREAQRNMVDRIIEGQSSNSVFDPQKSIGLLLFNRLERDYIARIENILHPELAFTDKKVSYGDEPLIQQNKMKYGTSADGETPFGQAAPAQAAAAPAPVRGGGGPGQGM